MTREGSGQHGDVIFTREQYAGRGQMGKSWISEPGQNLAMSLVLENAKLPDQTPFHLSAWLAVAALETLSNITAGDLSIKWPNDLYWKSRKLGGQLIESGTKWTIAGIGININQTQFPDHLTNPVSLRQITGKTFDPGALAQQLIDQLNRSWTDWIQNGFNQLLGVYQIKLFGKDLDFSVRENGIEKKIRVLSVDASGSLLIEDAGKKRSIVTGLEWIIHSSKS